MMLMSANEIGERVFSPGRFIEMTKMAKAY
jgi:hypothetical protein